LNDICREISIFANNQPFIGFVKKAYKTMECQSSGDSFAGLSLKRLGIFVIIGKLLKRIEYYPNETGGENHS
jgi:hypothetical protein